MNHSAGPTATLASITRDNITNCPDLNPYLGDTRLLGDAHHAEESWKLEFWVRFFEQDPSELSRFDRIVNAPMQAFADLARLQKATTGESSYVPPELIELIRKRVMLAYFPSADVVIRRAKHGAPDYARRCLLRFIELEEWSARG